jgi:isocitrate lyase
MPLLVQIQLLTCTPVCPVCLQGVKRVYTRSDVEKLRGSIKIEHTLARLGAERLWNLLHTEPYVHALGALTGNQAVQQVAGGLKAIYLSGWQVSSAAAWGLSLTVEHGSGMVDSFTTRPADVDSPITDLL